MRSWVMMQVIWLTMTPIACLSSMQMI
jgi:hypothetical protein